MFSMVKNAGDLYKVDINKKLLPLSGYSYSQEHDLNNVNTSPNSQNILENWKRWMEIRRKFHENAKQKIGREPRQLVMNRSDAFRKKMEDRLKIQYARIPKASKERGSPAFWTMPAQLRHPCLPPLFCVLTTEERCKVPIINFSGVPNCILQEKGIESSGDEKESGEEANSEHMTDMWNASRYKTYREIEYRAQIKKIQKHKPDIDNLCIIGRDIVTAQHKNQSDGATSTAINEEDKESLLEDIFVGIEIGDITITSKQEEAITQKYYVCIDYYIPDDGIIKHEIPLKNIGDIVLRFTWKRIIKKKQLDIIPKRHPCVVFCFKKTETVLMIGETTSIDIYFQIDKPGFYAETWELETIPQISKQVRFILVLWAFAEIANFEGICRNIHERIDEGCKQKIIDDIIVSLLSRVYIQKPEEYLPHYKVEIRERNLFNAVNIYDHGKDLTEKYYYEKTVCGALKDIYNEFKQPEDPEEWNFNVKDLERVIHNIKDEENKRRCILEYKVMLDKLSKSHNTKNIKKDIYAHVYFLLCATIDQISDYIYTLRHKFKIKLKEKYPEQTIDTVIAESERKNYHEIEFFSDSHVKPGRNLNVLEPEKCPKLNLQGSIETPDVLYKSYFKEKYNINVKLDNDDTVPLKGKDTKVKDDKGKKTKKDDSKLRNVKKSLSVIQELSLDALLSSEASETESEEDEKPPVPMEEIELYEYNIYMVTYNLLSKFTEDLVCAVDGFNQRIMPSNLLKALLNQPLSKWRMDHKGGTNAFDVDNENYDAESVVSEVLSSESYSFLKSSEDDIPKIYADIFTQTSGEQLYPDLITDNTAQTIDTDDIDKDILIEQLELEKNATSVHSIHSTLS